MHDYMDTPEVPHDGDGTGEVRMLDPKRVTLFRSEAGAPRLTLEGEFSCLRLKVMCSFPLSMPDRYISLRDGTNREIGMIENIRDLDGASRKIAGEEIERRYFLPEITAIYELSGQFGSYDWDVETNRGRRKFLTRGRSECIIQLPPNRVFVTDVLGNRYQVPDWTALDRSSSALIYKLL